MHSRKRILVVDDEAMVRFILHDTLMGLGEDYEIVTAAGGEEALNYAQEESFDLAITDVLMPNMSGIELTEALKTLSPETVVVWITAYDSKRVAADAERLGVHGCWDKPLEVTEILWIAKEALGISNNGHS